MSAIHCIALAHEALKTRRAQEDPFWPRGLVLGLLVLAEQQARDIAELEDRQDRIRNLCTESDNDKWMRELSRGFDGTPICAHTVLVSDILAALEES